MTGPGAGGPSMLRGIGASVSRQCLKRTKYLLAARYVGHVGIK